MREMLDIADKKDVRERQRDMDSGFYGSRNSEVEQYNVVEDPCRSNDHNNSL
jgi:hypothetical protein